MTDTTTPNASNGLAGSHTPILAVQDGQQRVGQLLAGLQDSAPSADNAASTSDSQFENQLALVRLGMATSLFYALRTKHASTAAHCLRVAISCSAWAERLGLDEATRDRIEVAALLHDLGKIGIPDRILRKPGKLSVDEQLTMEKSAELGCGILRGCTNDHALLDIVMYANTWYDSRRHGEGPRGDALPLGARMLAIADAFDAMTTDSVYRRAMSRERAIQELVDGSCTQFDPELAIDFNRMLEDRPEMLQGAIVDRWLLQLENGTSNEFWAASDESEPLTWDSLRSDNVFYRELVERLNDAIVFTDAEGTIGEWNTAMEELTSIKADTIIGQTLTSKCIHLREKDGSQEPQCPVQECLTTGQSVARSMLIERPGAEPTPVHVQVMPVSGECPGIQGTVMIARDLSDQTDLEEKIESLHRQTTRDSLTGLANRAHFDATISELTEKATNGGSSFSLIICDIDHFKRVNDVHGHPAGDEALVSFAAVLNAHSRDEDLVARYGGEEFLLLAGACDNATAAGRAETIRKALEATPLPSLGGEPVTASFGVTEFQAGDTEETILARADRALLKAKDNGRNRVIQLGSGSQADLSQSETKRSWLRWFDTHSKPRESEFDVVTPVPIDLTIEKLRGFIADHQAEIISVNENHVSLRLNAICGPGGRRRADHQISLRVQMTLSEVRKDVVPTRGPSKTNVHVSLQPIRNRDRRNGELSTCFSQVMASLRSYLMGEIRHEDVG
ncbi:MAG: diguanylate cyclase [Rubripirellula sp.]